MRRTPLLLAFFGAVVALLAISTSAAAAGKAVGQTKSAHASQTAQAATSKAHASNAAAGKHASSSSTSSGSAVSGDKFNCTQPDQDVPGASCDPSSNRGTEQTDNGKGNDCDPGYGGSNPNGTGPDHGNDNRYPNSSETEVPGCGSTAGTQTPPPVVIPPSPTPPPTGGVLGASGGIGGGGEFTGGVSAATGVGGAVAGATGVALADTGLRSVGFALLALLLVALGFYLIRRRGAARTA